MVGWISRVLFRVGLLPCSVVVSYMNLWGFLVLTNYLGPFVARSFKAYKVYFYNLHCLSNVYWNIYLCDIELNDFSNLYFYYRFLWNLKGFRDTIYLQTNTQWCRLRKKAKFVTFSTRVRQAYLKTLCMQMY